MVKKKNVVTVMEIEFPFHPKAPHFPEIVSGFLSVVPKVDHVIKCTYKYNYK